MELTKGYFDETIRSVIDDAVRGSEQRLEQRLSSKLERKLDEKLSTFETTFGQKIDKKFNAFEAKIDQTFVAFEQKFDQKLTAQTIELKQYTNEAFAIQQQWMEMRFDELIVKYDVRERVDKLEKEVRELKMQKSVRV